MGTDKTADSSKWQQVHYICVGGETLLLSTGRCILTKHGTSNFMLFSFLSVLHKSNHTCTVCFFTSTVHTVCVFAQFCLFCKMLEAFVETLWILIDYNIKGK